MSINQLINHKKKKLSKIKIQSKLQIDFWGSRLAIKPTALGLGWGYTPHPTMCGGVCGKFLTPKAALRLNGQNPKRSLGRASWGSVERMVWNLLISSCARVEVCAVIKLRSEQARGSVMLTWFFWALLKVFFWAGIFLRLLKKIYGIVLKINKFKISNFRTNQSVIICQVFQEQILLFLLLK